MQCVIHMILYLYGELMNKVVIRKATSEDAKDIAKLNADTWIITYKGLMPDEVLDYVQKTVDERVSKIAGNIKKYNNVFVAEIDRKIVGFCGYGRSENKQYADFGEIYTLYVLKEYQGYGIGKKLFMTGIKSLIEQGYSSMILNVLEGNKTIHFYEKYGGVNVGSKTDNFAGVDLSENVMFFDDLKKIYNENNKDLEKNN